MEVKVLNIGVIKKDNTILMRKKFDGSKPYKETWYMFGGIVENGKNPNISLKEMVFNQTNIEILYIKMHVQIEANKFSRIEETKTTVEEDMLDINDIAPEKRDDWEEVRNYIKTTNYGIARAKESFPVCNRLIHLHI